MAAPLREKCRTARGRLIVLTIQPNIGAIILSVEHCGHQGPAVSHAESGPCSYPMTQAEPTQTIGGSGVNLLSDLFTLRQEILKPEFTDAALSPLAS